MKISLLAFDIEQSKHSVNITPNPTNQNRKPAQCLFRSPLMSDVEGDELVESLFKIHRVTREIAMLVHNLRSYFEEENRKRRASNLSKPALRVSEALNFSRRSVARIASRGPSSFPEAVQAVTRHRASATSILHWPRSAVDSHPVSRKPTPIHQYDSFNCANSVG